jgi:outer membrane protein TolC
MARLETTPKGLRRIGAPPLSKLALLAGLVGAGGALSGCRLFVPIRFEAPVPSAPSLAADLPPRPASPRTFTAGLPPELQKGDAPLTLADVVGVALRNNPLTRASYFDALAAARQLESKNGAYYPTLDASIGVTRTRVYPTDSADPFSASSWGPGITLNYLLFDLGERAANSEEARQAVVAAGWSHNATIQAVVLKVQEAYYGYLNAKAQARAAKASLEQARAALDAANRRHDAGVATIAEILQAKTALSQAQLTAETFEGQAMTIRGALANAIGIDAAVPFDVGTLAGEVPVDQARAAVDSLIREAVAARPDLNASRALAGKADTHVAAVRSAALPTLSLQAGASRSWLDPEGMVDPQTNWSGRIGLTIPLFHGFSKVADIEKAKDEASATRARTETYEQQVVLQVWTAYYNLETATQRVRTSRDLLSSAEQSEQVALGRYREGVGTILELLTAQAALASARAQEIQARSDWFVSAARLAQATGQTPALDKVLIVREDENPGEKR